MTTSEAWDGASAVPTFVPARKLLKDPPRLHYLTDGLFLCNSLALWVGDSEALKSTMAIDLMVAIGVTGKFFGRRTDRGLAMMLAGEGHFGLKRRLAARLVAEKQSISEDYPLAISNHGMALINPVNAKNLRDKLQMMQDRANLPLKFFCVDTLAKNLGDGDENRTSDVSRLLENLDRYIRAPFGAYVAVLHHPGHTNKRRPRGSSALNPGVDGDILFQRNGDTLTLECLKAKDDRKFAPLSFRLKPICLPWKGANGKPEQSVVLERVRSNLGQIKLAKAPQAGELYDLLTKICLSAWKKRPDKYESKYKVAVPLSVWHEKAQEAGIVKDRHAFYKSKEVLLDKQLVNQTSKKTVLLVK